MKYEIPFLILGVTGPIGAGCTTLGDIIARTKASYLIKKKKLYEETVRELGIISEKMKGISDEIELEKLNKRLRRCYEERAYLNVIRNLNDPQYIYISMSELIIKLVIETMNVSKYNNWSCQFPELSEILNEFRKKWLDTIRLYNLKEKSYINLLPEELKNIDNMFKALKVTRKKIMDIELNDYFDKKIDELHLQYFGNNLRKTGNAFVSEDSLKDLKNLPIVAKEVNKYIKYCRNRIDDKKANCFVIDAFRNPAEVEFFRRYDKFYLISIYADEEIRQKRLEKNIHEDILQSQEDFAQLFKKIDGRDWGEDSSIEELHEQNVSKCYYMADISINNDKNNYEFDLELFNKFMRYYALIISPGCIQPSKEETFMNLAYSLSLRSSCISRKVGAVITDNAGFVLGLGWNEVAHGQIGCGLRLKKDFFDKEELFSMKYFNKIFSKEDIEQYTETDSICFKDVLSERKIREKLAKIEISEADKVSVLRELSIKRLEYCRSLHAEENALLQVASRGGMGVSGGEIYTTTFPCELCAKKIYQAGITRIYFTEPYPNSISEKVFLKDGVRNIKTKHFEGVKSYSYFKLYKPLYDKKEAQKIDNL